MEIEINGVLQRPVIDWKLADNYKAGTPEHKEVMRLIFESEREGGVLTPQQVQIKEQEQQRATEKRAEFEQRIKDFETIKDAQELTRVKSKNPYPKDDMYHNLWFSAMKEFSANWSVFYNERVRQDIRETNKEQDALLYFISSLESDYTFSTGEILNLYKDKITAYQSENNVSDLDVILALHFHTMRNDKPKRNY